MIYNYKKSQLQVGLLNLQLNAGLVKKLQLQLELKTYTVVIWTCKIFTVVSWTCKKITVVRWTCKNLQF